MKKTVSILIAMIMFSVSVLTAFTSSAETIFSTNQIGNERKKVINVVYDDSGSMVNGDESDVSVESAYVPTWAQAKYSLEVFAAMLNTEDELNVFCMSDSGAISKTIVGSDKEAGVKDIHEHFKTGDYSVMTPFQTLENAYEYLSDEKYEDYEKWLIILTDGAFTVSDSSADKVSDSKVSAALSQYGSSLDGRMIYIPIGGSAVEYNANSFTQLKAASGAELLEQVKAASEIVYYQRDKRELTDSSVNLGVSMKKIIVFAQGAGVEIESISKGNITDSISVKYTEAQNGVNFDNSSGKKTFAGSESKIKTDTSLQGVVATIEPNGDCIEPGQLNITFGEAKPKSYTIYYEPAVKAYYSLEKDGIEYLSSEMETASGSLNPGTYKLTAYIADAFQKDETTGKPLDVSDAAEIQDIAFDVTLSGSGVDGLAQNFSTQQLRTGVDVQLNRGNIDCKTNATILFGKYRVDSSAMNNAFSGVRIKDTYRLQIEYQKPSAQFLSYRFTKTNFNLHSLNDITDKEDMIKAVVSCYDESGNKVDISDEIWSNVTAQTLKIYNDETRVIYDTSAFDFHTENGCGVFYLCPRYWQENDEPDKGKTTHTNYIHRNELCTVRSEIYIDVSDNLAYSTLGSSADQKSTTYEISLCMWHTIIFLFISFWILACIFKRRLPKSKKGYLVNTEVACQETNRFNRTGWVSQPEEMRDSNRVVYIKRNMLTVLIPIIPQRGTIKLRSGFPTLKIKAKEVTGPRSRVQLINPPSDFESVNGLDFADYDNKYVQIRGSSITKELLKSKKNKGFTFSLTQNTITFGGVTDNCFRRYELSFKKNKKKGRKK